MGCSGQGNGVSWQGGEHMKSLGSNRNTLYQEGGGSRINEELSDNRPQARYLNWKLRLLDTPHPSLLVNLVYHLVELSNN